MLFNPGVGAEGLSTEFLDTQDEATVVKIPASVYSGEENRVGIFYLFTLWIVSLIALITNLPFVLGVMIWQLITKRKFSLKGAIWIIGRSKWHRSSPFVDWFSRLNHDSKVYAAGWRSLDIFYNFHEKFAGQIKNGGLENWLTKYWIERMENRQSVANRRKIATQLMVRAFRKFAGEPEIRLVSVASGSAQAVVDAMLLEPCLNVKVVLLDDSATALGEAEKRVEQAGLSSSFKFIKGKTKELEGICKNFHPHIIEMIGFLDYRPDQSAISLMSRIRKQLLPGGIFISCNINWNKEMIFLWTVLLWPMFYRSAGKFKKLIMESGFHDVELYSDCFRIHTISVCQK